MSRETGQLSLFHSRLVLLAVLMLAVTVLLGAQLARLTVVEGAARRDRAEQVLNARRFLPTVRGRILDRHGRVLVSDRAGYDIALQFDVITGTRVVRDATTDARRAAGRTEWDAMSPEARLAAIESYMPPHERRRAALLDAVRQAGELTEMEFVRKLDRIKGDVQRMRGYVNSAQQAKQERMFGSDAGAAYTPQPIAEEKEAHVVLRNVSDEVAFEFRRRASEWDEMVEVQDSQRRDHLWTTAEVILDRSTLPRDLQSAEPARVQVDGIADHILGRMRDEVWEADVLRRPFKLPDGEIDPGGYLTGDSVGAKGLEWAFENSLRGLRGVIQERRDTGHQQRIEAVPGQDLQLTIDIRLQARIQAILSPEFGLCRKEAWHGSGDLLPVGWPLNAAAVVMEIETGEVLAMVTMPTLAMSVDKPEQWHVINKPWANRPTEAVYPPGSIIKPIVLAGAVNHGVHDLHDPITCTGHYFPNSPGHSRCWIFREQYDFQTHGPLQASEAIARSCNIYFNTLAADLGTDRLLDWYRDFGMGEHLHCGLLARWDDGTMVGESEGIVPTEAKISGMREDGSLTAATIQMGIGQGPLAWTPLQAANAFAQLARGGSARDATIILGSNEEYVRPRRQGVHVSDDVRAVVLEGLRGATEEYYGTGHHILYGPDDWEPIINAENVIVWAKTGTAQAPPLYLEDTNDDGRFTAEDKQIRNLDHSWFVGLVGPRDTGQPMHVVAVLVEYGGSGGRVAGPVANQIIHALQDEGYLPGPMP